MAGVSTTPPSRRRSPWSHNGARLRSAGAWQRHQDRHLGRAAAMEPAAERREHKLVPPHTYGIFPRPQWSPPLTGGNTPAEPTAESASVSYRNGARRRTARARIRSNRRSGSAGQVWARPQWSPAVRRWEHVSLSLNPSVPYRRPQWSPPLTGGSTSVENVEEGWGWLPQWGPPSDSGSTTREPIGRNRPSWPQWSPPLNSGSTPVNPPLGVILGFATMERVVGRWQHEKIPLAVDEVILPQWSPPV